MRRMMTLAAAALLFAGCSLNETTTTSNGGGSADGEFATVVSVIDGDTIDVDIDGDVYRVRYIGMNTPERDEPCYTEATNANSGWVAGRQVRLVRDQSDTDRFDRLLRYVYVDDTLVNAALVQEGFAEVVSYPPDTREFENFRALEDQARRGARGCHPTGIFDDGSDTR